MADTVCAIGDNYLPASFNGVPFNAIEVSSEHGRRGAEGEFPFGENTAYADLGRRIRVYTLQGRLATNTHVLQAAALIAACELPGPGVLVHPTRGIVSAACRSLSVTDRIEEEGGVTYVDMEFVEGNVWPNGLSIVGTILGAVIGPLIAAAQADFSTRYVPMRVSAIRRPDVLAAAESSILTIRDEYQRAIGTEGTINNYRAISDLEMIAGDDTLLLDTELVGKAITLGINSVASLVTGITKFDTMRRIANANAKVSSIPNAFAADAENAVYMLNRIAAGVFMTQAANEAQDQRTADVFLQIDRIESVLSVEAEDARARCANALYAEIAQFLVDSKTSLYRKAYTLPTLVSYNFAAGVHPLVAAYSLFKDAKRHRELEQTNIINSTGRFDPVVIGSSV